MKSLKPFDLTELEQVTAIAHGAARRAWTVKRSNGGYMLIWANDRSQAAAMARRTRPNAKIGAIVPNHHAQNMHPRPSDWAEFVARGGDR